MEYNGDRAAMPGVLLRRAVTIPVFALGWAVAWLLTPIALPVLAASDLARRRQFALARAWLMLLVYLIAEVVGVAVSGWLWLRDRRDHEQYLERNFRLQCWWGRVQLDLGRRIFGIRLDVEGDETLAAAPYLLFIRHVSVIDNLIPAYFGSDRYGVRLRWVLNQTLLRDPCLDIVGYRLPNCFVRGGTNDSEAEIERMRRLAAGMGDGEGLVVYPEGTLFSPRKRERVLERLRAGDPDLFARAEAMKHVLPPRLGGSLAVLGARPGTDVVFCSHSGLDEATSRAAIAAGTLIGATLRVRFWRVPAGDIPGDEDGRTEWLLDEWAKVDAFAGEGRD